MGREVFSLSAWDRMYLRLATFLRRMLDPRSRADEYTLRQRSFNNASSGEFLSLSPARETIIITVNSGGFQRFSLNVGESLSTGLALNNVNTPFVLTREVHKELVTAQWNFSGFDGVPAVDAITVIEQTRL